MPRRISSWCLVICKLHCKRLMEARWTKYRICTYTMQHDPRSFLPELKKLLSLAYRRGLFASRRFDDNDAFALAFFLKDLLLEVPQALASLPFVAKFCLMFAFRVPNNGAIINMISCDTVSSVFSKISSVLKAAVCSVICSFTKA